MASKDKGPVEPLLHSVREVRDLLRLVGFTETTTEAGVWKKAGTPQTGSGRVCEESLVETLVRFRSAVRGIALGDVSSPGMKELLSLSDEMRDSVLPGIGVQLSDSQQTNDTNWAFCLPRKPSKEESQTKATNDDALAGTVVDVSSIPLSDFFRVGQYEGAFSEYTKDGTPTHNADGSEVSKRLKKKLLKKREKHRMRLEK